MHITIEPGVTLYVDVEGCGLVPHGPQMREKPTLILLHGGPGYDHSSFKPTFSQLADVAQINQVCKHLYNVLPANPQAGQRTVFNEEILFTSAGGEQQSMQLLPGLAHVQCPVLVMVGEQDPVTPLQDALDIAAAIPAPWGRLVRFANAGHGAWRDEPEAAMAVLREFITDAN